jgi:Nucleotidyl transferase AbiEii toxin, Type IV TA system
MRSKGSCSDFRTNRFVLKGGVLLAAYGLRRPTADIDGAALHTSNDVEGIRQFIADVASTALPADGLTFDLGNVTAEPIREEDRYSGVRVRLISRLASAREPFHVDVSIGDPIWPEPSEVLLPRLLGAGLDSSPRRCPTPSITRFSR